MVNIEVRTKEGNYELKDSSKQETHELLKMCRRKKQEVLELTIIKTKENKKCLKEQ